MQPKVTIKGIKEGLLISLSDEQWSDVRDSLILQLEQQAGFLKGGKVALDVGSQSLDAVELGKLRDEISDHGLALWAVLSQSSKTIKNAQALGMATRLSKPLAEQDHKTYETRIDGESAVLVYRTLRSGYRLQYEGHIVVIGDINPGAEVIAGGNVVVWGRLRGVVHAGAGGNGNAIVCALDLSPTQLRIAGLIAVTPQRKGKPQPEMACIQDGRVVAESWISKDK
jgi:septum site-determining protein MinC